MKIGIYISDILFRKGGTEAYCSYIINALQNIYKYPEITVISERYKNSESQKTDIASYLSSLFGVSIKNHNVNLELILADKNNFISRALFEHRMKQASKKYDIFFNCSINLFTFAAKYNIIIIHFPQYRKTSSTFVKKYPFMYCVAWLKDLRYANSYDLYIANSEYTMQWLKRIWNIDNTRSVIVNPAVGLMPQLKKDKTNSIFICSRIEHTKKIEILINAYLSSELLKQTCKLLIAGAVIEETESYATQIHNMIQNYQDFIVLHENPSRVEIEDYFNDAKIFWHAKGYQVDEETNPYELEHFGITTVEAMSAGCVPVVINKGGQKEIIDNGVNGFRWDTPEELIEKTIYLLQHDEEREKMAACAIHRANNFSLDKFTQNLSNALSRSKQ